MDFFVLPALFSRNEICCSAKRGRGKKEFNGKSFLLEGLKVRPVFVLISFCLFLSKPEDHQTDFF